MEREAAFAIDFANIESDKAKTALFKAEAAPIDSLALLLFRRKRPVAC
jgi:hypothetical protein